MNTNQENTDLPPRPASIDYIIIHWCEGNDLKEKKLSLGAADAMLRAVAKEMKESEDTLGYCKTKFTAHYEGGATFSGRFDVHALGKKQENSFGTLSFHDHICSCYMRWRDEGLVCANDWCDQRGL